MAAKITTPAQWISKRQAAEKLGVSTKTIENYAKAGKLVIAKPTQRLYRVSVESLDRLMHESEA